MKRDLEPWYVARDHMRKTLVNDLHGSHDDVELRERPLDRFIVGVLHPASPAPVEDAAVLPDEESRAQSDAVFDPAVSFSRMRYPSSMGLTFSVDPVLTPAVSLVVGADRYAQEAEDASTPSEQETSLSPGESQARPGSKAGAAPLSRRSKEEPRRWSLIPDEDVDLDLRVDAPGTQNIALRDGLNLRVIVRGVVRGVASVTLVLVNTFPKPASGLSDALCWFRPSLRVTAADGEFVDRGGRSDDANRDEDEESADLLYRGVRNVAVGHGCSASWPEAVPVKSISTTFFPAEELRIARPEREDVPLLGMRSLGRSDDRASLVALVVAYESWIDRLVATLDDVQIEHQGTARRHIEAARHAARRMRRGIEVIDGDPDAARAFRVMNSVMQEQRARQVMIRDKQQVPSPDEQLWRPFQMAFVLLNLEGLTDPDAGDRDVADLLWFPTGGGKTEAYLGLIAFTIVLRRLRGRPGQGGGVAVLMRYTLRLLTVQQFERAAGLICALEVWRRQELESAAPISIGMWVGQGATPNNVKDAAAALNKAADGREGDKGNPRQLLHCPWCGADLPVSSYHADVKGDRLTIRCSDVLCEFRSGLPAHVVDSDVYRERPALVIGTVDKFAMLAWNERAGRILGVDGAVDPPDLLVQDELHLISGPLGTLVGLYETAIDAAATGRARPKLIASTATIRRASAQVKAVFDRQAEQFPPPGFEATDNFFAVEADRSERGTRQYLGVMAPSASHSTLLVRTYAALLQGAAELDVEPEVKDAYWTLLGYFTSLRVLGAAYIQSIDDVPDRIKVLAERWGSEHRRVDAPRELTSRKRSSEIPEELNALSTAYPSDESPDIVLATNMISVGVDVDRLGLMVAMGQPQTTSEYIQATSRIGRQHPGLVVTLFNAARSRDLSHFESFTTYHRSIYSQVEATGATPFAARARDRGLHGVLVILARLLVPGASGEKSVEVPVADETGLDRVRQVILDRVARVSGDDVDDVADSLDALIDAWTSDEGLKRYSGWHGENDALLTPAGGAPGKPFDARDIRFPVGDPSWATLTSLRNVDAESTLFLARNRKAGRHGTH